MRVCSFRSYLPTPTGTYLPAYLHYLYWTASCLPRYFPDSGHGTGVHRHAPPQGPPERQQTGTMADKGGWRSSLPSHPGI